MLAHLKSYSSWWISKSQFVYFSDLLPIWTFDVYIYWIKAMSRNCIGRLWHHAHPYDIFLFQLNSQRLNSYSRAMIVTRVCPKKRTVKQQQYHNWFYNCGNIWQTTCLSIAIGSLYLCWAAWFVPLLLPFPSTKKSSPTPIPPFPPFQAGHWWGIEQYWVPRVTGGCQGWE